MTSAGIGRDKRPSSTSIIVDEAFFKHAYEKDKANAAKQSFKEYMDWVHTFYEGKRFPPVSGWRGREVEILSKLPDHARARVAEPLAHVGRILAAEWAKDNAVRKVSTSDLQTWGGRFKDAAKDADALLAALKGVEAELAKRSA